MPLNPHRRTQRLAAWLGLLAIWLMVLMPVGSQLLACEAPPSAPVCSAAGHHHAMRTGAPKKAAHHMDACGYCSLLVHLPALNGASCPDLFPPAARSGEVASPEHEWVPQFRCLWRSPRAPPAIA